MPHRFRRFCSLPLLTHGSPLTPLMSVAAGSNYAVKSSIDSTLPAIFKQWWLWWLLLPGCLASWTRYIEEYDSIRVARCDVYCGGNYPDECMENCLASNYTKPGYCPDKASMSPFEAVCLIACIDDSRCPDLAKCCRHDCGVTCMHPIGLENITDLPLIPENVQIRQQKNNLILLTWYNSKTQRTNESMGNKDVRYLVEERHLLGPRYLESRLSSWTVRHVSTKSHATLRERLKTGHWYQFRVAAINANGSRGYSEPSRPFKTRGKEDSATSNRVNVKSYAFSVLRGNFSKENQSIVTIVTESKGHRIKITSIIPELFIVAHEDTKYNRIFAMSDELNCFRCKQDGHVAKQCPGNHNTNDQPVDVDQQINVTTPLNINQYQLILTVTEDLQSQILVATSCPHDARNSSPDNKRALTSSSVSLKDICFIDKPRNPKEPQNLTLSDARLVDGKLRISLRWIKPASDVPITFYKVFWSRLVHGPTNDSILVYHRTVLKDKTCYELKNLELKCQYFLQVQAVALRYGETISQMRAIPWRSSFTANDLSLRRGQGTSRLADEPRCKGIQRLLERGILLGSAGKTRITSKENFLESCSDSGLRCLSVDVERRHMEFRVFDECEGSNAFEIIVSDQGVCESCDVGNEGMTLVRAFDLWE
ncbi:Anosmin-1 [Eufriesea mexicana]|nr:Anosmin-1 [Eufriesea mexicana]